VTSDVVGHEFPSPFVQMARGVAVMLQSGVAML